MKFRLLLGSCLLVNALTLQANERWFEVEMIIFERTGDSALKEHFPTQVTPIRLGRHIDLLTDQFYIPLPVDPECQTSDAVDATGLAIPGEAEPAAECMPQPTEQTTLASDNTDALLAAVLEQATPHQYWPEQLPVRIFGEGLHQPVPYLADENAFQLNEVVNRLRRQRQHQILLHTVWRQAPVTERRAIPSRWFAGKNFSQQFDYWGQPLPSEVDSNLAFATEEQQEADLLAQIASRRQQLAAGVALTQPESSTDEQRRLEQSAANLPSQVWQLDGLFRLHLDRYLFVNTDFNLRRPQANSLQSINVKQSRRLISGEIHYLDHPKLGIILQIRRFDPATARSDASIIE
ncbi:hypothetical protein H1D31_09520 [Alishewanella sp. BS5-314]|uniref:peptidoglycan binding protein CsiV n=1 Tax=Alishewanella sp. BS5-314 TaxID=2755587 RepID=UPI0021BA9DFB|nr:peptidoglycan binding protein CsiV [Alishewanella sp. BS5-314]MCT8126253.1 hypothetical protein [Alishewanella sp. BS5-314]